MFIFYFVMFFCFVLMELYLFFFVKRALTVFLDSAKLSITALILSLAFSAFFIYAASFILWVVFVAHLMAFSLLVRLLYCFLSKVRRDTFKKKLSLVYRLGIVPVLCVITVFVYGYFNITNIGETSYSIQSDKLSEDSEYKIAFMADIHYGTAGTVETLRAAVNKISRQKPDALILGGDIIDEDCDLAMAAEVFEILGSTDTKSGVYFVYGNHDYSAYLGEHPYSREALESVIKNAGITVLDDKTVDISDEFTIAGRLDKTSERKSTAELLKGTDKGNFILVADHQPTEFSEKEAAGADLQISGHTHGGQIFPIGYINTLISPNELCYGIERVGDMTAIVSSGVYGWGFPLRTQAPSEYVIVAVGGLSRLG